MKRIMWFLYMMAVFATGWALDRLISWIENVVRKKRNEREGIPAAGAEDRQDREVEAGSDREA